MPNAGNAEPQLGPRMPSAGIAEPQLGPNDRRGNTHPDASVVAEAALTWLDALGYPILDGSEPATRELLAERTIEENIRCPTPRTPSPSSAQMTDNATPVQTPPLLPRLPRPSWAPWHTPSWTTRNWPPGNR